MKLSEKQQLFVINVADLIRTLYDRGYNVTFGDAYRDPRVFGKWGEKKYYSAAESNHKRRLAVDLNLFKDGRYLTATKDYLEAGKIWEMQGQTLYNHRLPLRWGGRFSDGNHFEWADGWRWRPIADDNRYLKRFLDADPRGG